MLEFFRSHFFQEKWASVVVNMLLEGITPFTGGWNGYREEAMGPLFAGSPAVVGPLHRVLPVDLYVPGCPPAPEGVINALMRLQERVARGETYSQKREAAFRKALS